MLHVLIHHQKQNVNLNHLDSELYFCEYDTKEGCKKNLNNVLNIKETILIIVKIYLFHLIAIKNVLWKKDNVLINIYIVMHMKEKIKKLVNR